MGTTEGRTLTPRFISPSLDKSEVSPVSSCSPQPWPLKADLGLDDNFSFQERSAMPAIVGGTLLTGKWGVGWGEQSD